MGEIIRRTKAGRFIGWYLRYVDADGKRKQRASHQPTRELARRMLIAIEARVARGQVGIMEPPPPAPTVAEVVARFLTEYSRPAIKDLGAYRAHARTALRRALPALGTQRIDAVQKNDVARLRDALARQLSPGSAGQTLAFFAAMCAWAVRTGLLTTNPARGVEKPKATRDLVEYLSAEEVAALLHAADRCAEDGLAGCRLRAMVHLAVRTGLRKGELLGLRWRDLDLSTRRLTIARSFATAPKSGQVRHLRLPAAVVPILAAWTRQCPRTQDGLVFPGQYNGTWGMVRKTGTMLGLPALLAESVRRPLARPWHCLRHTFASHFVMAGGNILTLQKLLGHSDVKMTQVYAHLAPDFLAEELDRIKF